LLLPGEIARAGEMAGGAFGTGLALRHVTPERVLHSNFGCCIGTRSKSETYKISGAAQRRAVPIRELVENKARRLKKKNSPRRTSRHPNQRENLPSALAAVKGQAR